MLAVLTALVGSPVLLRAETYTLRDLYRIALEQSEKVRISEENVAITGLTKDKALSVLFPRLTAYGGYVRFSEDKYTEPSRLFPSGQMIQPNATSQWGVRLEQSFSLSARELTALRIAQTSLEMTRYTDEAYKNLLLEEVARAYYQVLQAGKIVEIAQANVARLTLYRQAAEGGSRWVKRPDGSAPGGSQLSAIGPALAQNGREMARAYLARPWDARDRGAPEDRTGGDAAGSARHLSDRAFRAAPI